MFNKLKEAVPIPECAHSAEVALIYESDYEEPDVGLELHGTLQEAAFVAFGATRQEVLLNLAKRLEATARWLREAAEE